MNGQTTGTDWIGLIMASNEAALRWAQLFTGRSVPGDAGGVVVTEDRVEVGSGGLVLLGLIALGVFLLLKD
jgi:hypothetical protein